MVESFLMMYTPGGQVGEMWYAFTFSRRLFHTLARSAFSNLDAADETLLLFEAERSVAGCCSCTCETHPAL